MSDWLDALANDWGHWMRRSAAVDGSIQGTLGKISEEGLDGAAIRSHSDRIPVTDFPLDVAKFHRAWRFLEPHLHGIIFVDYRMRAPLSKKLGIMHMKKSKYYRLRRTALDKICQTMSLSN